MTRALVLTLLLTTAGCKGPSSTPAQPCPESDVGEPGAAIALDSLACFERVGDPVLRDPFPGYEIASDAHVFHDETGTLRMIYTGEGGIKLATGTSWGAWTPTAMLLGETGPSGLDVTKETSFYRRTAAGTHQIYYIGYDDEDVYASQLYLAEADDLLGPYTLSAAPIVPLGLQAGHDVRVITSPSVVEHEDLLYLMWLGWDASPSEVTEVWILGATSADEGQTWSDAVEVETPIGMEGQVTVGPDGRFWATAVGATGDTEGILIAVADHPFGPFEKLGSPSLVQTGEGFEKDTATAPQLSFDDTTRTAYLFYVGADYDLGWWTMLATTSY